MSRVALVTGGSKGLGAHLVRRFWLAGYSLVVVARNEVDIHAVLDGLPKRNDQSATPLVSDLADATKVHSLLDVIKAAIRT